MRYKFRAECQVDVDRFIALLDRTSVPSWEWALFREDGYPDVTVIFQSDAPIGVLRYAAARVVDGHVMAETLELEGEYTGERVDRAS